VESLLELWRQPLIGLRHVGEEGVATGSGTIKNIEECCSGWLFLKSDVRVPGNCVGALCQEIGASTIVCTPEDQVDFWESLGGTRCLVNVVTTEVASPVNGFLDGEGCEVLIAEGYI
jgi:hypothetical protein